MITKLKLREVQEYDRELKRLGDKHLPTSLQFAIARNRKVLADELQVLEEQRLKYIDETAKRDKDNNIVINEEKGTVVFADKKAESEFGDKYKELLNTDTEINISAVKMDIIEKCEFDQYDSLTVDDVNALLFMLEE
jgi:hypothetical protein